MPTLTFDDDKSFFGIRSVSTLGHQIACTDPSHIVVVDQSVLTMLSASNLEIVEENGQRYAAMFVFKPGAEGSILDVNGTLSAPADLPGDVTFALAMEYGLSGPNPVTYLGSPSLVGIDTKVISLNRAQPSTDWIVTQVGV